MAVERVRAKQQSKATAEGGCATIHQNGIPPGLTPMGSAFSAPSGLAFFSPTERSRGKNVLSPVTRRQTLGTWVLSRFVVGRNIHLTRSPALITIGIHRFAGAHVDEPGFSRTSAHRCRG